jgi:flavin-binding protein dodecin
VSKTYKKIEIVGTSQKSFSDAVKSGIERASQTVKNMDWFEVVESRGLIEAGAVAEYQVTLKVGFRLE